MVQSHLAAASFAAVAAKTPAVKADSLVIDIKAAVGWSHVANIVTPIPTQIAGGQRLKGDRDSPPTSRTVHFIWSANCERVRVARFGPVGKAVTEGRDGKTILIATGRSQPLTRQSG